MTNVFDITEFGAVGDGLTDCTAAIQTALDKAAEVEGKAIVPPGKYACGMVKMGKRTRLEGSSGWNFRADGLSTLILNDPEAKCLLDITGAFGCSVAGICMDGKRLGKNVHGIYLYWEQYNGGSEEDTPCIDDCRVGNFTGDGVHLEHIWCFSVRHSMIHRNAGCGLYIDGWDAFILDNWFTANGNGGMLGGPCAASITATCNRVEWNTRAGFEFGSGSCVNVTGNYFDRTFGPALKLGGEHGDFRNVAVTGNVFYRGGCPDRGTCPTEAEHSHVLLDRAKNVTLTGNTFKWGENDGGGGTKSPDHDVFLRDCDACVVQSNVMFEGALQEAIVWDGKGECIIKDNAGIR